MPSKGVDVFGYVSNPRFTAYFSARGNEDVAINMPGKQEWRHYEIDKNDLDIWPPEATGCFRMRALIDGKQVFGHHAEINPDTGGIADNNMGDWIDGQRSFIKPEEYAVSFGFTDTAAMPGISHQAYLYITEDQSDWMGRLRVPNRVTMDLFVLPGSHDAGAFKRNSIAAIDSFSNTQKDTITVQLQLGARFFDFRPGYDLRDINSAVIENFTDHITRFFDSYPESDPNDDQLAAFCKLFDVDSLIEPPLRHLHSIIPGEFFLTFLTEILNFLKQHPGEIVVVSLSNDGFGDDEKRNPKSGHVEYTIARAIKSFGGTLVRGGVDDLRRPYADLLMENRRIIIFNKDNIESCYRSSWDGKYETEDMYGLVPLIENALNTKLDKNNRGTVLQLCSTFQTTATGAAMAVFSHITHNGGPLLYAKARFDHVSYNWLLRVNNTTRFGKPLVVLLNDFIDNALTDICATLTQLRFHKQKSIEIIASDFDANSINIGADGSYGSGVIYNVGNSGPDIVEYEIIFAGPTPVMHRLEICYAAAESRPVEVYFNDSILTDSALSGITGGWMPNCQISEVAGFLELKPGVNRLKLFRNGPFPHIQNLCLSPEIITIDAASFYKSQNISADGSYGPGVIFNICTPGTDIVEYQLEFSGTMPLNHTLEVLYAAAESRPVELYFNDILQFDFALADTTGGWQAENQMISSVGSLELRPGRNCLKILRKGPIPHIRELRFIPEGITLAASFFNANSRNVKADGEYGPGVIHHAGERGKPDIAEYDVFFSGALPALHRLEVLFASADNRPVEIYMNGQLVMEAALIDNTGGWYAGNQRLDAGCSVLLSPGKNCLKIQRNGVIPHIQSFRLTPEIFSIPAASLNANSRNVQADGEYGPGVIHHVGERGKPDIAEYDIMYSGSVPAKLRLNIQYAAGDSRPVEIYMNECLVTESALVKSTGGWQLNNQAVASVGYVDVNPGMNKLKIYRNGVIPHIREFRFQEIPDCMEIKDRAVSLYGCIENLPLYPRRN